MNVRNTCITIAFVAGTAAGQSAPVKPASQPANSDVLGGPAVHETVTERTLAKRDMQGRVRRLDLSPEESALELLNLDTESQRKADVVVADYHRRLDAIVGDNIDLLLRIQGAKEGPDRQAALREAGEKLAALNEGGKLRDRIAAALPDDQAKRYNALIDGYWKAILDETQADARDRKDKAAPSEIQRRELVRAVGDEIRRSYDRQIAAKSKRVEELLTPLGLSPEQDGKVRAFIEEFAEQTKGKANGNQRRDLFGKIMKELTPEQKKQLLREVLVGPAQADTPPSEIPMKATEGTKSEGEPAKDGSDSVKK